MSGSVETGPSKADSIGMLRDRCYGIYVLFLDQALYYIDFFEISPQSQASSPLELPEFQI